MNDLFDKLSPFEKTVLLELARCQASASVAWQLSYPVTDKSQIPAPKDLLKKALDDSIAGILETLKQNQ